VNEKKGQPDGCPFLLFIKVPASGKAGTNGIMVFFQSGGKTFFLEMGLFIM